MKIKKLFSVTTLLLILQTIYAQEELPSNSFESIFYNTSINYRYIEEEQTHDYSGNWDIDGDGITDSIMFVGNGGAHLLFNLFINLSSESKNYNFNSLLIDLPILEPIESFCNSKDIPFMFSVYDFNEDGLMDILLKIDNIGLERKLKRLGVTSNKVILYYDRNNKKIIIKDL